MATAVAAQVITDTARFAAYPDTGGKNALLLDLDRVRRLTSGIASDEIMEIMYKLGNTTTSGWSDATRTVAQMEAAEYAAATAV